VEIAFGFAARPQMFTGLALVSLLWLVRRISSGRVGWVVAVPLLFAAWINAHGGVLAGWVLLWLAACSASPLEQLIRRWMPLTPTPRRARVALWVAAVTATFALLANPWGVELLRWLAESVSWLRPEIEEWNPTPWGWDHAPFFALLVVTIVAWIFSERPKSLWEAAVLGALAVAALRSVRHTPLFCIVALALMPPYVADLLRRSQAQIPRLSALIRQPATQIVAGLTFTLLTAAIISATWRRDGDTFGTMAVPRAQYPLAAIAFIQQYDLKGNLLVFFDWGELCLWELPDSTVSFDGRLDTCYPHALISEHWKFYRGQPFAAAQLDLGKADLALLPHLPGAEWLARQPGWAAVYVDPLAVVLARDRARFARLATLSQPAQAGMAAVTGRAHFPDAPPPRLAIRANSR
jgi:hypothetical protein